MLDEEWIDRTFRYELRDGYRLDGLLGVGGTMVALNLVRESGVQSVLKIPKKSFLLYSYLKEVPLSLSMSPKYSLVELNVKLKEVIGDPDWHEMVPDFDELFEVYLNIWRDVPLTHVATFQGESKAEDILLRFIFQTSAIESRVQRLWRENREWVAAATKAVTNLRLANPSWLAENIEFNPLFIWGGAAMSGFFTNEELPTAASASVDALSEYDPGTGAAFMFQARLLMAALRRASSSRQVSRFALFLDCTCLFDERLASDQESSMPNVVPFDWLPS